SMPLRNQATRLVNVLLKVVDELDSYAQHERSQYARTLVDRLRPLAASFEQAVLRDRSRKAAETSMLDIRPIMAEVNAAAVSGEMAIVDRGTLSSYWDLATIFQETTYSGESL